MARVAVIGEGIRVSGFALAGAEVHCADEPSAVRDAWSALTDDVAVVILTPGAAESLADVAPPDANRLTVVMPA